jgi:hypothetical protein
VTLRERSGAGLSFPGNHIKHPPFPAIFTWGNRPDRLGKGSASVTGSNFWGWMFRLSLSAVGWGKLNRYSGTTFTVAGHLGGG